MSSVITTPETAGHESFTGRLEWFGALLSSALAGFVLILNVGFNETFRHFELGVSLVILLLFHLLRFPRFVLRREHVAYGLLFLYMLVELIWTDDIVLARGTLMPAANFFLALVLFSCLVQYYSLKAVLSGTLIGLVAAAALYSSASGFPLRRPPDFSYNAIAGIYLLGLFLTLMLMALGRASRLLQAAAFVFFLLIVATTSIKTNLGVLLGAIAAGVLYFRQVFAVVRKNVIALLALGSALGIYVATNETLRNAIESGYDRIMLGIEILQRWENVAGYSGFERRAQWAREGFEGWLQNPVFGHGVETFRSRFDITSHSTIIDLLYNAGLIGFVLFYSILLSVLVRLFTLPREARSRFGPLIVATMACYAFISLSGVLHYYASLATAVALSVGIIERARDRAAEA